MTVRAGQLRARARLERPVFAADGGGGAAVTWELVADVWAAIGPVSGGESERQDRQSARVTHEFWIRYRAGVTAEMRMVLGARMFDLRAVIDAGERRRWLRCLAEEKEL